MATRHGTGRSPLLRRPAERPPAAPLPTFSALTAPIDVTTPKNIPPAQQTAASVAASPAPQTVSRAMPPASPIRREQGRVHGRPEPASDTAAVEQAVAEVGSSDGFLADAPSSAYWGAAAVVSVVLLLWLYGPTIGSLFGQWQSSPDYVHGFLVVPVAGLMLWVRKSSLPACGALPGWGGLLLVAIGLGLRFAADRLLLPSLAGWSLVVWLAGACWLVAGFRVLAWALPAVVFLSFLVPLPEQIERLLSGPVQTIVTDTSAALLVCLGRPAIAEGHSIFLGEHAIAVDETCSGLGVFFGITAVAVAFSVLRGRNLFEKMVLLGAVAPVAILATAARVAALSWAAQGEATAASAEAASRGGFGWVALLVAVAMFGVFVIYLRRLLWENFR